MDIAQFLNNVASGNAVEAQENINDILSAKAFEALDAYKQEIAKTVYNNSEEEIDSSETETDIDQETNS